MTLKFDLGKDICTDMSIDTTSTTSTNTGTSSNDLEAMEISETNMEKLWAKEQYEMPPCDREATFYEMHGVESRYKMTEYEDSDRLNRALLEFDNELRSMESGVPLLLKRQYHIALSMNSSYVMSSDFRMRFLRAEFFDVTKAAIRFCKCLNFLVRLFGEVSLMRQLFLSDLTKREMKLLKEGGMQLSPSRDPLGRRLMFLLGNCGGNYTAHERDRVGIYLIFQVLAEDVTTQRNGLVTLHLMSVDVYQAMGGEHTPKMSSLFLSLFESSPVRFSSIHMCFPDEFAFRLLKPLLLFLIGKVGRKVLRIHSGTTVECNYSLSSFGVRPEDIPTTYSGTIKTRHHTRWLKVRSAIDKYVKEQARQHTDCNFSNFYTLDIKPFPHIYCPGINGVLFRKNGVAWVFPGNVRFRAFLDEEFPHINGHTMYYDNDRVLVAPSEDVIVNRIIKLALPRRFKFLLYDDAMHWYVELTEPEELRKYVRLAYRGHLRRCGVQKNRQGGNSLGAAGKVSTGYDDDESKNDASAVSNDVDTDDDNVQFVAKRKAIFTNLDGNQDNSITNCCIHSIAD